MSSTFVRRALCVATFIALLSPVRVFAQQAAAAGAVAGVLTSLDGRPIQGASVTLEAPGKVLVAASAKDGHFSLQNVPPGTYSIRARAVRFNDPAVVIIEVKAGATTSLNFALARSESSLTTIGQVRTNGGQAVSTSSTPITTINPQTYADQGFTRVSDVLQDDANTTLFHTVGAGTVLPTSVAIRGPDPTETLVDIDGHQVNNGNTGDFDLSLLDPADYSSIELVKGISPSSLVGPDTIDGAINIRTIEPTVVQHGLERFNLGSYGSFGGTLQETGTIDNRLGYAFSLHRQGTDGEVNQNVYDQPSNTIQSVGSSMLGNSAIGKLRYAFGNSGGGYAELSFHDQSAFRDFSAGLTNYAVAGGDSGDALPAGTLAPGLAVVDSYAGTAMQSHNAGYGLDVSVPLGSPGSTGIPATTVLLRTYISQVDESVVGPGAETTPYLFNSSDTLYDDTLQLDHRIGNGDLTLQYEIRNESLLTDFIPGVVNEQSVGHRPYSGGLATQSAFSTDQNSTVPGLVKLPLGQRQASLALRYTYNPTPALHFTIGGYYSQLNLFGNYLDPRFGFVFTPDSKTAVRASAGTTFQAPQLPELVVPNPLPVVVGDYISVGNPNLKPDQATEYGLGFDRILQGGVNQTSVSADVYRVNLRQPASPLNLPLDPNCGPVSLGGDGTPCPLSYPVNAGDGVYQGIELSARHNFGPWTTLRTGWAVRSAYLTQVPADIQDGTLVVGEQSAGLPLHKATVTLVTAPPQGLMYGLNFVYEGLYNELNQGPYATLGANIGFRKGAFEYIFSGTNLTDVYDTKFILPNGGVIYGGLNQEIPQDAYPIQGRAFNFSVLRRF